MQYHVSMVSAWNSGCSQRDVNYENSIFFIRLIILVQILALSDT